MKRIVSLLLFGLVVLSLATTAWTLTACKTPVEKPLSVHDPVYLPDLPLCGLAMPDDDSAWRQVWRTDRRNGGVTATLRDGDWLWAATPGDLVRLDLRTLDCTRFDLGGVRALVKGPDGRLWASTSPGLARFDGQHWQTILDDRYVYTIAFDIDGNLWGQFSGGGRSGLVAVRYPGHEPPENGPWEGEYVQSPPYDACDQWMAQSWQFRSAEECRLLAAWRRRLSLGSPPEGIAWWSENQPIAAESDEHVWILAQGSPGEAGQYDTLLSFDGREWRALPWHYGTALLVSDDARGGVWAGTSEGLIFSDGRNVQKYLLSPGDAISFSPTTLSDLLNDSSGNLWSVSNRGLLLYDEASDAWQPTEFTDDFLLVSADDRGGLWAVSCSRSQQVSYFDGETWTHHPLDQCPCAPVSILADVGGGLWLSSHDCALRGFDGQGWDEYDNGFRGDTLFRGPDGTVYAVERGGLGNVRRYDGDAWETLPPVDPSPHARVIDLVAGPGDEVWVACSTSPGLLVYRDGEWKRVLETHESISALMIDSRGDLWAGHGKGLWHYDGKTWEHIESEFPLDIVHEMAQDRQGRIWMAGGYGLIVYDPASTRTIE